MSSKQVHIALLILIMLVTIVPFVAYYVVDNHQRLQTSVNGCEYVITIDQDQLSYTRTCGDQTVPGSVPVEWLPMG